MTMGNDVYGPLTGADEPYTPEDFTYNDYLRLKFQQLEQAAAADPVKYPEDWVRAEKKKLAELFRGRVDVNNLPDWYDLKKYWVTNIGGTLLPGGQVFITPGGDLYDKSGNPFAPEAKGSILSKLMGDKDLTPYEQSQIDLAQRKYELDIAQFQQGTQESDRAYQLKLQQMQDERAAGLTGGNQANERAMRQKDFELWKSQTMLALEQPADWIKRWEVMHTPSPVAQPQGNWYEGPLGALAGKRWEDMTPLERGAVNAMDTTINPRTENQLSFYGNPRQEGLPAGVENTGAPFPEPSWMPLSTQEARQIIADINQKAGILASAQVSETPSRTPPAPSWLPQFAPSQRAGQTITRGDIVTPSGQQWSRTPWSVQQGLRGYADWSGGRAYEDILGEMESMLPKTPRGAGYASWRPRRT